MTNMTAITDPTLARLLAEREMLLARVGELEARLRSRPRDLTPPRVLVRIRRPGRPRKDDSDSNVERMAWLVKRNGSQVVVRFDDGTLAWARWYNVRRAD